MSDSIVSILIQAKDQFSDVFQKATAGMGSLSGGLKTVGEGLAAFSVGAVGAAAGITALAVKGSEYADFQNEFNRLAGKDAPAALDALHSATLGAVSDLDLFNTSNRLMNQGIGVQTVPVLADFANRLKETTNQFGGVTDIMGTFGQALATGRVMMLEQMGITVDNKKAFDDYAKSIGLVGKAGEGLGSSLDESQKKFAMQAAIIDTVKEKLASMPKPAEDAEDAFKKMQAQLSNTTLQIGAALSPAVTQLLGTLNQILPSIQPLIPVLAGALTQTIVALTPVIQLLAQFIAQLATMFVTQLLPALLPLLPPLTELIQIVLTAGMQILEALMPAIVALIPVIVALLDALNPLLEIVLPPLIFLLTLVALGIKVVAGWVKSLIDVVVSLIGWLVDGLGAAFGTVVKAVEEVIGWFKQLWDWGGKIVGILGDIIGKAGQAIAGAANAISGGSGSGSSSSSGTGRKMAAGGIVLSPTQALIGEAGPEAVIPLDQMKDWPGKSSGPITVIQVTIDTIMGLDADDIATALDERLRTMVRSA